MIRNNRFNNRNFYSLAVATLLLVVTFALIGFVALSVLTGNSFDFASSNAAALRTPQPATVVSTFAGTPGPNDTIFFKSSALGFSVDYPADWRKNEQGLRVIFSPSADGLDPDNLQDSAIWLGIPANDITDPAALLAQLQADILPENQPALAASADLFSVVIDEEAWQSKTLTFNSEQLGGPVTAQIMATSKDEVGYFAVAIAPTNQWNVIEPVFENILNSYHFTTEAVLRPTDATPPPTPTATPTPVIYVVQSGDTLGQIAVQFGVEVDALAARNGIDDPRTLRTGVRLIIPRQRSR